MFIVSQFFATILKFRKRNIFRVSSVGRAPPCVTGSGNGILK